MKRRIICLATLMVLSVGNFASAAETSQFGDNPQRTHYNGIDDPLPWKKISFLQQANDTENFVTVNLTGNGNPISQNNFLVYPVTSPNMDPDQWGNLVAYSTREWQDYGGQKVPKQIWGVSIKGVSNSTPILRDGIIYIAAGDTCYKLPIDTGVQDIIAFKNIRATSPVYRNQVVSHPLYVTGSEQGTAQDLIWISSQNGWLYAVNPQTMMREMAINLQSRLDGSPSLVTDSDGNTFIAVASAYSPNNAAYNASAHTGGTGTLFIIDPRQGKVVASLPSSVGPVVTAPMATGYPGSIVWNDYNGNVFFYRLMSNMTFQYNATWNKVGGSGATTNNEGGYSPTGYYVLPFSTGKFTVAINLNNPTQAPKQLGYFGNSVSSPVLSKNYLYVADDQGIVNQIEHDATTFANGGSTRINFSSGFDSMQLANPYEGILQSAFGQEVPTLSLGTNQGLQIWQTIGAIYKFDGNYSAKYTSGQPVNSASLPPLTLTLQQNNLDYLWANKDNLTLEYSIDGGAYQPLQSPTVFQVGSGKLTPSDKITIPLNSLSLPSWSSGQHKVTFRASSPVTDVGAYYFNSEDSGWKNGNTATVTYTFTGPGVIQSGLNLSIKYDPFTTPIAVGSGNIPVTVSNSGNSDVTTDVVLVRHGYKPNPVYVARYDSQGKYLGDYLDHYDNVPDAVSYKQTVTIPAKSAKKLSFVVSTGRRILGTASTGFYDDPDYKFQVVTSVNDAKNPTESTYEDNQVSLWIPTTGMKKIPPGTRLTD